MNINQTTQKISLVTAISLIFDGISLALKKEFRAFVLIPILINLVLFSVLGYVLFYYIKELIFDIFNTFPDWLVFVAYILSALLVIALLIAGCYFFSTVATIIASPFYGILADKVELYLNNTQGIDMSVTDLIKDIPRILLREGRKQLFFLPLALLCLLISLVPVLNFVSPFFWFALTSWMGCLQYADYAYDNHHVSFKDMQQDLKDNYVSSFTLGATVSIALLIPIVNLLIPPAAVCAGTKYYLLLKQARQVEIIEE